MIELLIVIAILGVILGIIIVAINPFEHINQANDVAKKAITQDFSNATTTYFTSKQALPWQTDITCKNELAKGPTLKDVPTCVKDIAESSQLQSQVIAQDQAKDIYISECNHAVALCYHPKSQLFGNAPDAKYTKNGALDPNCPINGKSGECYSCTFSTNNAQECFEALNPNGNIARSVNPDPNKAVPIPKRNSKNLCNTPASGQVSCSAKVVSSSSGAPFTSIQLPAGLGPLQLHTAYNLPCTPRGPVQAICNIPTTFGPQTLAVVLAFHDPTLESDLVTYSQAYGLPTCTKANGCLMVVNEFGQTSPLPTTTQGEWSLEESLDVEMSHTVCQTCKILVVEANTNYLNDILPSVNVAAQLGATSISNSYATEESANSAWDQSYIHKGIYVTAASGDWGYGLYFPAASRYVIAVGATRLNLLGNNEYSSETAWSGTGGGCSAYQNVWNFQANVPNWNLTGCGTKRSVADLSAVGDPNTGVAVYDSTPYVGQSGWWVVGGTSASSPIVAAALTLSGTLSSDTLGSAYVYAHQANFRDVTTGSNGNCGSTACNATTGYDGPTGLGSPNILSILQSTPTPSPTPIPTLTPTLTPTPIPSNCLSTQTASLTQSGIIIAHQGDTVSNILNVTSNDSPGCSAIYTTNPYISSSTWSFGGIPASFTLSGGSTTSIPFAIHVPSTALTGYYGYQFRVTKAGQTTPIVVNGTVQIQRAYPTPEPYPIGNYNLDDTKFLQTYAVLAFPTQTFSPDWEIDISFKPDFSGTSRVGFGYYGSTISYPVNVDTIFNVAYAADGNFGTVLSTSYAAQSTLTPKHFALISLPYLWTQYTNGCGKNIYWRVVGWPGDSSGLIGPTYTNIVDCTTKVGVEFGTMGTLPQDDFNSNGVFDSTDYVVGSLWTKFRAGGWQPPE